MLRRISFSIQLYILFLCTDFQSQTKCRFAIGDAIGSKIRMGFSQTPAQCIDDCLRLQGIDSAINGASIYSDGEKKGCWCVKRLIDLDSNGAYKTCFLPNTITGKFNVK